MHIKHLILAVLSLAVGAHAYEEEYDASLHENDNKNVYLEIPALGNGFAFLYPSRVFSAKVDLGHQFGILAEPIVGYGIIKGFGTTAGFYHRNGKNFNGLKYAFTNIERFGPFHEVFYDYDRYLRTRPGLNLRFGLSLGVGMTEFSKNKEDEVVITPGATFRVHLDLSYLIKYN